MAWPTRRTPKQDPNPVQYLNPLAAAGYDPSGELAGSGLPTPPLAWYERLFRDREVAALQKSIKVGYLQGQLNSIKAANQGAVVNPALDVFRAYENDRGIQDPTGITFDTLRRWARTCEPVVMIHTTIINKAAAFAKPAVPHEGYYRDPGFRIKMTQAGEEALPADEKAIIGYTQLIMETGWCAPPIDERPVNWQPGFEPFLRSVTRDRLTLDHVCIRTWTSKAAPGKFPIVCFTPVDAALIRKRRRVVLGVKDGELLTEEGDRDRTNTKAEITLVKVAADDDARIMEEYTDQEMFCVYARPRTDEAANGYGESELELCFKTLTCWIAALDYNASRFNKDVLPRGILSLLGNINQQQLQAFQLQWRNMMEGVSGRWSIPIIEGKPDAGSSIAWTPLDQSQRDMEYTQFMYSLGTYLHGIYGISPDETNFSEASPVRPPLSEASPEENLDNSRDSCLAPLLRWTEAWINHKILWRIDPTRRYTFEFVGLGQYNEADDVEVSAAKLNTGITTPRLEWAKRDTPIPDAWKTHPAWDFPAPFAVGYQMLSAAAQQQQGGDMAQQQQDMNADNSQKQNDLAQKQFDSSQETPEDKQARQQKDSELHESQQVMNSHTQEMDRQQMKLKAGELDLKQKNAQKVQPGTVAAVKKAVQGRGMGRGILMRRALLDKALTHQQRGAALSKAAGYTEDEVQEALVRLDA